MLEKHALEAVAQAGGNHQIVKISDYAAMVSRGVMSTPALALDGQLKAQGRVISVQDILQLLKG
jgi:predicted thioredoxin/glutaredoxin